MIDYLFPLILLTIMQIIFGIDNALFISLEANKLPPHQRKQARNIGVILAGVARIILLFVLVLAMKKLVTPFWSFDFGFFKGSISLEVLIMFGGGLFLCYESVHEMLSLAAKSELAQKIIQPNTSQVSKKSVITQIIIINVIFSIDSILTAIAITDKLSVMIIAITISVVMMIVMAERLSVFLSKFEIFTFTGLQILALIGTVLIGEGAHKGNFEIFGWHVVPLHTSWLFLLMVLFGLQDYCLFKKRRGKQPRLITKTEG